MTTEESIFALDELGQFFGYITEQSKGEEKYRAKFEYLKEEALEKMQLAEVKNAWFSQENIQFALAHWSKILTVDALRDWVKKYHFQSNHKTIGIVMAGNLPLVGLHDLICILISGFSVEIKLSSKDEVLMKWVISYLSSISTEFEQSIKIVEKLENFDAVIATGSTNTARYFQYYFSKVPHIIRENRTSVAVLDGNETVEDLQNLGSDIFRYFGLGCRNVTHIFVPENYDFKLFFESIYSWSDVMFSNKYGNNYNYNRTVFLMENANFLDNNFLLLKKDDALFSPIGCVNYSFYNSKNALELQIKNNENNIQCVVSNLVFSGFKSEDFGNTQKPQLHNYADGVDTMKFLTEL